MAKNVRGRNARNNNPYLAIGVIAIVLTVLSTLVAFYGGIGLIHAYDYFLNAFGKCAGGFNFVAAMLALAAFGCGIAGIVHNKKFAFISAILSIIASLLTASGLGVAGFDWYMSSWDVLISLSTIASAFSLTSFVLFAIYWAKAPIKTVYYKKNLKADRQNDVDVLLNRIALLNKMLSNGILTSEEVAGQKQKLFSSLNRKSDSKDYKSIPLSNKKTLQLVFIPILVLIFVCGCAVTGLQFACCETLYGEIENVMTNLSMDREYIYSYHTHGEMDRMDYLLYEMWSYDYKDVDNIRRQYMEVSRYLSERESAVQNASDIRGEYGSLVRFRARGWLDSRWNLDEILTLTEALLYSAKWSCGNKYIEFKYQYSYWQSEQLFFTNLPNTLPEQLSDDHYYTSLVDGELIIGYIANGNRYDAYRVSNFVYDYDVEYNYGVFSIDVYCYADDTTYTMTKE